MGRTTEVFLTNPLQGLVACYFKPCCSKTLELLHISHFKWWRRTCRTLAAQDGSCSLAMLMNDSTDSAFTFLMSIESSPKMRAR